MVARNPVLPRRRSQSDRERELNGFKRTQIDSNGHKSVQMNSIATRIPPNNKTFPPGRRGSAAPSAWHVCHSCRILFLVDSIAGGWYSREILFAWDVNQEILDFSQNLNNYWLLKKLWKKQDFMKNLRKLRFFGESSKMLGVLENNGNVGLFGKSWKMGDFLENHGNWRIFGDSWG